MKKILITSAAAILIFATPSFADNPNWSLDKQYQIEVNRMSDAGIGNGGERMMRHPNGPDDAGDRTAWNDINHYWDATTGGEDGGWDVDPGNSQAHNWACGGPDADGNRQGGTTTC